MSLRFQKCQEKKLQCTKCGFLGFWVWYENAQEERDAKKFHLASKRHKAAAQGDGGGL